MIVSPLLTKKTCIAQTSGLNGDHSELGHFLKQQYFVIQGWMAAKWMPAFTSVCSKNAIAATLARIIRQQTRLKLFFDSLNLIHYTLLFYLQCQEWLRFLLRTSKFQFLYKTLFPSSIETELRSVNYVSITLKILHTIADSVIDFYSFIS